MQRIQVDKNTVVYRPEVPDRNALIQLYDVLNEVNKRVQKNDFFYTDEEVEELMKDPRNVFL